jgi:hypothetical protein
MPDINKIADSIKNHSDRTLRVLVDSFNHSVNLLWKNPAASADSIVVSLGTDAKNILEDQARLGQFLNTLVPDRVKNSLESIGQYTPNEDGSVTIQPKTEG